MPTFQVPEPASIVVPVPRSVSFHHEQSVPALTWTINHNLGYKPALADCKDSAGTQHAPWREDPDVNTTILTFLGATDGFADLC